MAANALGAMCIESSNEQTFGQSSGVFADLDNDAKGIIVRLRERNQLRDKAQRFARPVSEKRLQQFALAKKALDRAGGVKSLAARDLGVSRNTIRYWLGENYGERRTLLLSSFAPEPPPSAPVVENRRRWPPECITAPVVPNIPPPPPPPNNDDEVCTPSPVPLSFAGLPAPAQEPAPGAPPLIANYSDLQRHKSVNSRKNRPAWANNEQALMQHVLSNSMVRRWTIAYLYWLRNWTAREIAAELGMSTQAVKDVLRRLRER